MFSSSARAAAWFMLLAGLSTASGHASFSVKPKYCTLPLVVGEKIMGAPAVTAPVDKEVMLMRGDAMLKSGDAYLPGEKVAVSFEGTGQMAYEADGGAFENGGCEGKRFAVPKGNTTEAVLVMPADGYDVKVFVAYAPKKGALSITQGMVLKGTNGPRPAAAPAVPQNRNLR